MRWISNDNLSPEDKKKMGAMHNNNNPMLQALRANLPVEQRQRIVFFCHVMGHSLHEATPNRHDELPKDVGFNLNRAVLGVIIYIYMLKPVRHDLEHEGVGAQDVT